MVKWDDIGVFERENKLYRNIKWLKEKAPKYRLMYDELYPPEEWKDIVIRLLFLHEGSRKIRGSIHTPNGRFRTVEECLQTIKYYYPEQSMEEVLEYINHLRHNEYIRKQYCPTVRKFTYYKSWSIQGAQWYNNHDARDGRLEKEMNELINKIYDHVE